VSSDVESASPADRVHPVFGVLQAASAVPPEAFTLTAAVRDLVEASVMTDVEPGERAAVAGRVQELTARLRQRERADPVWFVAHDDGTFEHLTQAGTGRLNPQAISGVWLTPEGDEVFVAAPDPATGETLARSTFSRAHAAAVDRVDSGPIAVLLDHVISFALVAVDRGGMTVSLQVRCHAPTPYGVPVLVRARYTHSDGRKHFATGEIVVDGEVTASARGVFVGAPA
jgi:acyl-coenzyme A thioesterase PaaI-like protein